MAFARVRVSGSTAGAAYAVHPRIHGGARLGERQAGSVADVLAERGRYRALAVRGPNLLERRGSGGRRSACRDYATTAADRSGLQPRTHAPSEAPTAG